MLPRQNDADGSLHAAWEFPVLVELDISSVSPMIGWARAAMVIAAACVDGRIGGSSSSQGEFCRRLVDDPVVGDRVIGRPLSMFGDAHTSRHPRVASLNQPGWNLSLLARGTPLTSAQYGLLGRALAKKSSRSAICAALRVRAPSTPAVCRGRAGAPGAASPLLVAPGLEHVVELRVTPETRPARQDRAGL